MIKITSGLERQFDDSPRVYRQIPEQTKTVPDQSLGIKEILRRSMAGIPSVGYPSHYDGDSTEYDDDDYDLTDIDPEQTAAYKQAAYLEKVYFGDDGE